MSKKQVTRQILPIILYYTLLWIFFFFDCMHACMIWGSNYWREWDPKTENTEERVSSLKVSTSHQFYELRTPLLSRNMVYCGKKMTKQMQFIDIVFTIECELSFSKLHGPPSTSVQANVFHINLLIEQEAPTLDIARAPLLTLFSFLWKY